MSQKTTPYDGLAWFYDRYWAEQFISRVYPQIEKWLLVQLPSNGRLLDLCCGTGQLAARLTEAGYRVVGVDNSSEMLDYAYRNAKLAIFQQSDAENFTLPEKVHGAVSVFDSLNHLMTEERLLAAFASVFASLEKGGLFFFDLNVEEGFVERWKGSWSIVESDHVLVCRSSYDQSARLGKMDATMFRLIDGNWQRRDEHFVQTAFVPETVTQLLTSVGFVLQKTGPLSEFGLAGSGMQIWLAENR